MMKPAFYLVLGLNIGLMTVGCAFKNTEPLYPFATQTLSKDTVTETDNHAGISLPCSSTLTVKLPENGTTGYVWEIVGLEGNMLCLTSDTFVPDQPVLAGSGGTRIFTLKALARGSTTFECVYRRPWEKDVPAIREFKVFLVIE